MEVKMTQNHISMGDFSIEKSNKTIYDGIV